MHSSLDVLTLIGSIAGHVRLNTGCLGLKADFWSWLEQCIARCGKLLSPFYCLARIFQAHTRITNGHIIVRWPPVTSAYTYGDVVTPPALLLRAQLNEGWYSFLLQVKLCRCAVCTTGQVE